MKTSYPSSLIPTGASLRVELLCVAALYHICGGGPRSNSGLPDLRDHTYPKELSFFAALRICYPQALSMDSRFFAPLRMTVFWSALRKSCYLLFLIRAW